MIKDRVIKTLLPNKVVVITQKMTSVRSVSIGVWLRSGSCHESVQNNGISHFLEHLVFKGTKRRSALDIAQCLEVTGGSLNASTGKDYSVFTAHVLDDNVETAIDVLSDILLNPVLNEDDIEHEKNVVYAEILAAQENPEEMVTDYYYGHLFPGHPLGFFIYGTPINLERFNSHQLRRYLTTKYLNTDIVFAAAGNVDHATFCRLVEKYFTYSPTVSSNHRFIPLKPMQKGLRIHRDNTAQQAHIIVGSPIFGVKDERKYALALLDVIFGGGMSSRLFQNIREKYGFAYSVYSFTDLMAEVGLYGAYLACSVENVEQSLELVEKEFDDLLNNPITDSEIANAKSHIIGTMLLGMESSHNVMRKIGETELYAASHLSVREITQKIEGVTMKDIKPLIDEYFSFQNLNITLLAPPSVKINAEVKR
jgi:predicted Zn-dependent peptidase